MAHGGVDPPSLGTTCHGSTTTFFQPVLHDPFGTLDQVEATPVRWHVGVGYGWLWFWLVSYVLHGIRILQVWDKWMKTLDVHFVPCCHVGSSSLIHSALQTRINQPSCLSQGAWPTTQNALR